MSMSQGQNHMLNSLILQSVQQVKQERSAAHLCQYLRQVTYDGSEPGTPTSCQYQDVRRDLNWSMPGMYHGVIFPV